MINSLAHKQIEQQQKNQASYRALLSDKMIMQYFLNAQQTKIWLDMWSGALSHVLNEEL